MRPPAITVVGPVAALRDGSPGRSAGRCTASRSASPGRARRPPTSCGGCATWRRRGRGARDPDRADRRDAHRRLGLRPRLPDEPERARAAARAHRRRRAPARGRRRGRDRARHGGGDPRDRHPPRRVAERAVGEGLLEALADAGAGRRVLVARAEEARDTLPDGLHDGGCRAVDVVAAVPHRARRCPPGTDALPPTSSRSRRPRPCGSSRRLRRAATSAPCEASRSAPSRRRTMRELGIPIVAEAAQHDLDGLVAAYRRGAPGTGSRRRAVTGNVTATPLEAPMRPTYRLPLAVLGGAALIAGVLALKPQLEHARRAAAGAGRTRRDRPGRARALPAVLRLRERARGAGHGRHLRVDGGHRRHRPPTRSTRPRRR